MVWKTEWYALFVESLFPLQKNDSWSFCRSSWMKEYYRVSQKNALSELASICIGWTIPGHQMDRGLDLVAGKWELTRGCLWKPILKVRFLGHPVDDPCI